MNGLERQTDLLGQCKWGGRILRSRTNTCGLRTALRLPDVFIQIFVCSFCDATKCGEGALVTSLNVLRGAEALHTPQLVTWL